MPYKKPLVCEKCGIRYMVKIDFECHILKCVKGKHTKTMECQNCGKLFAFRSGLYRHKKKCCGPDTTVVLAESEMRLNEIGVRLRTELREYAANIKVQQFPCNYIYIMCDPTKFDTKTHPSWESFLESIFFVERGINNRPFIHLRRAHKYDPCNYDPTLDQIGAIWAVNRGVVLVEALHYATKFEADNLEASIVWILKSQLTNEKEGLFTGICDYWNEEEKEGLGIFCLQIFYKQICNAGYTEQQRTFVY